MQDTFDYVVSDGNGGFSTATVTLTVATNMLPVALDIDRYRDALARQASALLQAEVSGRVYGGTTVEQTNTVDLVVGVSYSDDLDKVRKELQDLVAADDRILDDPACTIAVSELADSSVNFVVRPWVESSDYWGVYMAVHEAIKKAFDAQGISIVSREW